MPVSQTHSMRSLLCYSPEGFYLTFPVVSVQTGPGVSSVENAAGLIDPDLSNPMVVNTTGRLAEFTVGISAGWQGLGLPNPRLTFGLVGLSPRVGSDVFQVDEPILVELEVRNLRGFNQYDRAHSYVKTYNPSWQGPGGFTHRVRGGPPSALFHNHRLATAGVLSIQLTFRILRSFSGGNLPIEIGHLFVGRELVLDIDPTSFVWSAEMVRERYQSRSLSALPSDAVLRRSARFDARRMTMADLLGQSTLFPPTDPLSGLSGIASESQSVPSLMRAILSNSGAPMVLSPYPFPLLDELTEGDDSGGPVISESRGSYSLEQELSPAPHNMGPGLAPSFGQDAQPRMLSVRQNAFSIFGQFQPAVEVSPSQERDGVRTRYSTRLEFTENL